MKTFLTSGPFYQPSYKSEHHTPPQPKMEQLKNREPEQARDRVNDADNTDLYSSAQHQHDRNNHVSPSPFPDSSKNKFRRKIKKSESESGITKLFKTLRKEGGFGRKASIQDVAGQDHRRSETRDRAGSQVRSGSLDRSSSRKRNLSPDHHRAKSMDRRTVRSHKDQSPERSFPASSQDLWQTSTPERQFRPSSRGSRKESYFVSTTERSHSTQALTLGHTPKRGLKNRNILHDSLPSIRAERQAYLSNGSWKSDSSSDGSFLEESATPQFRDCYNTMKASSVNETGVGRRLARNPQSKR